MKVAVLYSFNDIRIEDWRVPEVEKGEALVKMRACGICSGDVMPWYIEKKAPLVLGHEPAGQIVAVGDGVENFKPGDMVFMHHHAPCMECPQCRKGNHVLCDTWRRSRIIPGGLAEYVKIPAHNLTHDTLKLPQNVGYIGGTLVEPLACVVKGMRRMGLVRGESVLVIGLGVMGMLFVILARHMGASKVIGADMVPYRLAKALELGAHDVVDITEENSRERLSEIFGESRSGIDAAAGADRVVVGPGSIPAMAQGLACAGPGGTVLFFTPTPPGETLKINPNRLYFNEITVVQSYSCGPDDTKAALKLLADGVIPVEELITHRFPLGKAAQAFRLTADAKESLKAVITFD
ncbi:MAG: alcohol dehydrogenase catalytic domain-containing protein [Nitrospirota bacterium]